MKKILFVLLMVIPSFTFAQQAEEKSAGDKAFSIGLTFSPDYFYRILTSSGSFDWIKGLRSREEPIFGYTTGISLNAKVHNRVSLETGLLLGKRGEQLGSNDLVFGDQIEDRNNFNYTAGPSIEKVSFKFHYYFFEVPIKVKYYLLNNRSKFYIAGGTSVNVFLFDRTVFRVEYSDGSVKKSKTLNNLGYLDFNRINLAILGGFGYSYDLTEKSYFKVEPIYRQSVVPLVRAPIKQYIYSAGIDLGYFRKF